ncbi:MAG: alcohol dehydrogenase catalytic domain-containing protein [Fimbriimonadales bacterium]|nr:alcohol dehydrogenase catalytic domain-containing protein [Fimbriimonadales bacterium]
MLQAWLSAPRQLSLRDAPIPHPDAGEIVVKVRLALTCGTDLKTYRRGHAKLPFGLFGHEGAGEIVAVGAGVEHLQVGQRVTWLPTAPCRECFTCRRGRFNLCRNLFERVVLGSYAEYLKINARVASVHVFPLEELSDLRGAFVEPLSCVLHAWRVLEPLPGKIVCLLGTGAMAYLHLMEAKARGCFTIVVGRRPERLTLARELGADEVVLTSPPNPLSVNREGESVSPSPFTERGLGGEVIEKIRSLTDGGADIVIEATGAKAIWEIAPELAAPGGKVLLYSGLAKGETVSVLAERWHYDELTILGSFHFTTQDAQIALQRLRQHEFAVERLITATRPLNEIVEVFEQLDQGEGIKYAIVP